MTGTCMMCEYVDMPAYQYSTCRRYRLGSCRRLAFPRQALTASHPLFRHTLQTLQNMPSLAEYSEEIGISAWLQGCQKQQETTVAAIQPTC